MGPAQPYTNQTTACDTEGRGSQPRVTCRSKDTKFGSGIWRRWPQRRSGGLAESRHCSGCSLAQDPKLCSCQDHWPEKPYASTSTSARWASFRRTGFAAECSSFRAITLSIYVAAGVRRCGRTCAEPRPPESCARRSATLLLASMRRHKSSAADAPRSVSGSGIRSRPTALSSSRGPRRRSWSPATKAVVRSQSLQL